ERVDARPVFFELSSTPHAEALETCDLVVVHVRPETQNSDWLSLTSAAASMPMVFVGARDHLLGLDPPVQAMAREFLMDSWQPDEALVRLALAVSERQTAAPPPRPRAPSTRTRVVVAADDTVLSLVRDVFGNFGIECIAAHD